MNIELNNNQLTVIESLSNTNNILSILSNSLYNKYFGYLIGLISIILLFQYLKKRYKHNIFITKNNYYLDTKEIVPNINYYLYSKNKIIYLFWNGNISSTYLLYYLLIDKGLPVQTIYIKNYTINENLRMDTNEKNIKTNDETRLDYILQTKEISRMNDIRNIIYSDYPFCKSLFLPTFYVYCIHKDLDFTYRFKRDTKFIVRPNMNTIERIVRFTHYSNIGNIMLSLDEKDIELYNILNNNGYTNKLKMPLINLKNEDIKLKFVSQKNHKKVKLLLYLRNYNKT